MTTNELQEIFPAPDHPRAPDEVLAETGAGERIIWHGGPDRWGLFRATPFVIALALALGVSVAMSSGSGLTPGQYLWRLAGSLGADPALVVSAAAVLFFGLLIASLRDPRDRWTYVVTDRRLMTFHKGRKLREADVRKLRRLRVSRGIEGRLRNVGDVIWAKIANTDDNVRGPDRGRHGFRGMRDPETWKKRLQQWGRAVEAEVADDARAFARRAPDSGPDAASAASARQLPNRPNGFSIELPQRWVGRIGRQRKKPLELLGLKLPIPTLDRVVDRPLHDPPAEWNFIEVHGRSGMKFTLNVEDGPPPVTGQTARARAGKALVDADEHLRQGPLTGYRVDSRHGDRMHVRRVVLAGDGFHVQIIVAVPGAQADDLLPAIDAVLDSIRAI
jgi:hypothetical protein